MIHKTIQIQEIIVKELAEKVSDKLVLKIEKYLKELNAKKDDTLITRQEVASYLSISLQTIHNWTKKGVLSVYYMGNRVYYKKEEIFKTLERNSSMS